MSVDFGGMRKKEPAIMNLYICFIPGSTMLNEHKESDS